MTTPTFQCTGITKAKTRCRIRVPTSDGLCHYHSPKPKTLTQIPAPRESRSRTSSPSKSEKYQRGFIYIYTLTHLLEESPKKKDWLLIRHVGKDTSESFNPKKNILIKVGLTQGSVEARLKQWEKQCSHHLSSVNPFLLKERRSLAALFKGLRIGREPGYIHYETASQGFYCPKNLYDIEQSIHRYLRTIYGRGDVACHGCNKDSAVGHGIHVEWFKVPRKELKGIFTFIDKLISQY